MELRLLIVLFRRWFWLLLVGAIIGGAIGYYNSISQPSVYRSSTKLMVMQPRESLTSDLTDLTDAQLAETFRNLLVVKPVLQATSERVGGAVGAGQISSKLVEGTQLLQVTVQDKDPERAALIANTLVEVLIAYNDSLQTDRFSASEESLQAQIAQVEAQMEALRAEEGQRTQLTEEEIAAQQTDLEAEIRRLSEEIDQVEDEAAALSEVDPLLLLSPVDGKMLEEKNAERALLLLNLEAARNRYGELLGNATYEGEVEIQRGRVLELVDKRAELESSISAITGIEGIADAADLEDEAVVQDLSADQIETLQGLQAELALVDSLLSGATSRFEALVANEANADELEAQRLRVLALGEELSALDQSIADLTDGNETAEQTAERRSALRDKEAELAFLTLNLDLASERYKQLIYPGSQGSTADSQGSQSNANMALYQQIYSSLLSNYEAVRLARTQGTPNIVQVELATPGGAVRPNEISNAMLGAVVGMIIMGSIAFLIEYLDDTLKTPEDVDRVLGLPVVGLVTDVPGLDRKSDEGEGEVGPYVGTHPRAPLGEAFRSLRTNLEFADVDDGLKTILVTSSSPSEGKTTIAANLAASFSQQQKRVLLLDCDLRKPTVHRVFDIPNDTGMTDVFLGRVELDEAVHQYDDNLAVITSGSLPSNPAELLGSDSMTQFLDRVGEMADIVVIDSPPSIVSDAAILSAKVDGVILVVVPGKTQAEDAQAQMEQMQRAGARVVGVVMNRIPRKRGGYYSRYGYKYRYYREGYGYGYGESSNGQGPQSKKKRFRLFRSKKKKSSSASGTGTEKETVDLT